MNYFVAALPRSRTAWLSAFLSQSGQYCFHDGMNGCNSILEYRDMLSDFGDSSTGLHLFDIGSIYPGSPVVIIDKSDEEFEQCIKWCDSTYGGDNRKELIRQRELLQSMEGMRVNQSDIDASLKPIFQYLTGTEWKPEYENIRHLNIQSDPFNIDVESAKRIMLEAV